MTARVSRKRALVAVWAFALIVTAWTSIQVNAQSVPDGVTDTSALCTVEPCSTDPNVICTYYTPCGDGRDIAVGSTSGEVDDALGTANGNIAALSQGTQARVGNAKVPSPVFAPISEGGGTYEDTTNSRIKDNKACVALDSGATTAQGATRSTLGGQPCSENNVYHCWEVYIDTQRNYQKYVYWYWLTKMTWCGWSMGKIESRTYNDHENIATGAQCALQKQQRTPVEKIDGGHWQQHSNFTFECRYSNVFKQDIATEGAHYYNNGYYQRIEKGGQ